MKFPRDSSTKNVSVPSFIQFKVPHLKKRVDAESLTRQELRRTIYSRKSEKLRASALGCLLKKYGFASWVTDCIACLLVADSLELRGTVYSTVFAAMSDGLPVPTTQDADLLISVAQDEESLWLKPWAMAFRHKLTDVSVVDEAQQILNGVWCVPASINDAELLQRALVSMARRILSNNDVKMFMF